MRMLIAIPVFNEASTLERVLQRVREVIDSGRMSDETIDVLVVNDGSSDGTGELLQNQQIASVLTQHRNLGYGRALIDAFGWAHGRGYDWVITMDCDEQHEPAELPRFFAACREDTHDIVSGSRYLLPQADEAAPHDRRAINQTLTREINERLGDRFTAAGGVLLTDTFCGFKAHRTLAMMELDLSEDGYAFPMQFWVRAAAAGLRICEIPTSLLYLDASRSFGGVLDNPEARLSHYRDVLHRELALHDACLAETPTCTKQSPTGCR